MTEVELPNVSDENTRESEQLEKCIELQGGQGKYHGQSEQLEKCIELQGGQGKYHGHSEQLEKCLKLTGGRGKYHGESEQLEKCIELPGGRGRYHGEMEQLEKCLELTGGRGRYQLFQHLVINLCFMSANFQLLNFIFIGIIAGRSVPHQCHQPLNGTSLTIDGVDLPTNSTVVYNQCSITATYNTSDGRVISHTLPCDHGFEYTERKDISIISEFDLVCDDAALGDLPQTLLILGQALAGLTFPFVSDRYGRKFANILCNILVAFVGVGVAYSPNYIVFSVLRVLMGMTQQGLLLTSSTYAIEIYPTKYRRYKGTLDIAMWAFYGLFLTPIAYLLRDESWRTLQLVYTSACLVVVIQLIFLDESFLWLVANGKYQQALKNITKAARMNKMNGTKVIKSFKNLVASKRCQVLNDCNACLSDNDSELKLSEKEMKSKVEKYSLLDIFRHKRMAINTLMLWFLWCSAALCYLGLFFTSSSLVGDKYLNVFLSSLMDFPPFVIFWLSIDRFGRTKTAGILFLMTGVSLILASIIKTTTDSQVGLIFITILFLIGKTGASGAFSTCFAYTPELFPTNLRNIGLGSASVAARVGGMMAPFSRLLGTYIAWGPGAIFGIFGILAAGLTSFLPETKGKQLPQTMADRKLLDKKESN